MAAITPATRSLVTYEPSALAPKILQRLVRLLPRTRRLPGEHYFRASLSRRDEHRKLLFRSHDVERSQTM